MVSPTQAESTDVAAVLARADADAHRARVMAAKLEVYEGAFLHDAPTIGADPTTAAGVAEGLPPPQGLYKPPAPGSFDRARGARRAFGETVAAPAVAAEIKRLSAEKAPREIPREIKASKRPATQGRWGHTPPAAASNVPPFAAAAVAVATPGPSAVPTRGRARAAEDARAKAKAPIVGDRTRRVEGLPRSKIKPPTARAGGGCQPVGRRRRAVFSHRVSRRWRRRPGGHEVAAAAGWRNVPRTSAGQRAVRRSAADGSGRRVSLRLLSEDTTAARPTAASEARRLPTQAEVDEAEFRREIAEEWVEVEVPAAVTTAATRVDCPPLDLRAFKEDVKSLMAAHDDALGGRAGRGRQPPPTDVSIKIEAPPPPERPWGRGGVARAVRAAGAARPAVAPPPPESPHYPKTLEDYARRNPAVEVGRPSQQPPPLESWPSEPLAATAPTPPRATAAATAMKSPATGGKKESAERALAAAQAEAALLRKSLDSAKRETAAASAQFLPPPHATSRAVRHEMGVQTDYSAEAAVASRTVRRRQMPPVIRMPPTWRRPNGLSTASKKPRGRRFVLGGANWRPRVPPPRGTSARRSRGPKENVRRAGGGSRPARS